MFAPGECPYICKSCWALFSRDLEVPLNETRPPQLDQQGAKSDLWKYVPVRSPLSELLHACLAQPGSPSDSHSVHDQSPTSPAGRRREKHCDWAVIKFELIEIIVKKKLIKGRWPDTTWVFLSEIAPKRLSVYDWSITAGYKFKINLGALGICALATRPGENGHVSLRGGSLGNSCQPDDKSAVRTVFPHSLKKDKR